MRNERTSGSEKRGVDAVTSAPTQADPRDRPDARSVSTDRRSHSPEEGNTARSSVPEGVRSRRVLAGSADVSADYRTVAAVLRKLQWLDGAIRGAHATVRTFRDERDSLLWESGTDSGYYLDWRSVQHNCAPELIIVLRRDPSRIAFDEHPYAVIVPLVGHSWSLMSEDWLMEIQEYIQPEQMDEAAVALNTLDGIARTMDPKKRSNAMSVLATAKRLFQTS
jgi:hypothetical protein